MTATTEPSPPPGVPISARVWLAVIMATGLAVALLIGPTKALFIDEYYSIPEMVGQTPFEHSGTLDREIDSREIWSTNSLAGIYRCVRLDNGNMSLFAFLNHLMVRTLGTTRAVNFQVLSITAYLVSIWGCFRLGRMLFSDRVGLIAAALFMANFNMIQVATEVRAYSLAIALCLLSTMCFTRIAGVAAHAGEHSRPPAPLYWSLLYGLATLVALLSHFLSGMIILGHIAYALILVRDRGTWFRLTLAGAFVVLVFVPLHLRWLSSDTYSVAEGYFAYLQSTGRRYRKHFTPFHIATAIGGSVFQYSGMPMLAMTMAAAALPVSAIGIAALVGPVRRRVFSAPRAVVLLGILAFVCLGVSLTTLAMNYAMFPVNRRYQVFSIPYFAIAMAWLLHQIFASPGPRWSEWARKGFVVLYLAVLALSPVQHLRLIDSPHNQSVYPRIAREIARRSAEGSLQKVVVPTMLDVQLLSIYMGEGVSARFVVEEVELTRQLTAKLKDMGLFDSLTLYLEFVHTYESRGILFNALEAESDTGGVLRFRYGKMP